MNFLTIFYIAILPRDKHRRGYFVYFASFNFPPNATKEIKRLNRKDELEAIPVTVEDLRQKERISG